MSSTKTTIIAIVVIVVTFSAGVAVGVFGAFALRHRGRGIPKFASQALVNRLDRSLDLTDEQRTKITAIVERRHQRISEIWRETRPEVDAEIKATNAEIEKVLTPEQRKTFQQLRLHLDPPLGDRNRHHKDRR